MNVPHPRLAEEHWKQLLAGSGVGPWECGGVVTEGSLREAIDARVRELRARRREIGRDAADFEAASRFAPYRDDEQTGRLSAASAVAGVTVFQAHLLATDEREHVARLLEFFDLPRGARVLDAGCGVGGVAGHMHELRSDLRFVMLNTSRAQLELCPPQFPRIEASIEDIGLPAVAFDAVMANYVLGHARLDLAFAEAARVTRPGGLLLVCDICTEDSERLIVALGYNAHRQAAIIVAAKRHGFTLERFRRPSGTVRSAGIAPLGDAVYEQVFGATYPVLLRFTYLPKAMVTR